MLSAPFTLTTLNHFSAACTFNLHDVDGGGGIDNCILGGGDRELTEALRHSMVSYQEHLNDVSIEMQTFQSCIATKGWQIEGNTPEDGNCFFWAVSSQLDRLGINSLTHSQLRQRVVAFIQDLSEVLL